MVASRKAGSLALLFFLTCGAPAALCQSQSDTSCQNSTVEDARGPEFAARAKTFLAELQAAVEKNDQVVFASLVQYPVRVVNGSSRTRIPTAAQLIKRYSSIVTPAVRNAILNQSAACLFGNYQGVMIGSGEIWFEEQSNGKMKIITVNTSTAK